MVNSDLSMISPSISHEMRAIFDAHFAFVWRYMAQRGVKRDQIGDLVHNVFRVVREHPMRRQENVRLSTLVCMVSFQVLRAFQKRSVRESVLTGDGDDPTDAFHESASIMTLDTAIESLPELDREVYLLCEGEQIPFEEVSDALGVPEAIVMRKYAKAKKEVSALVAHLRDRSASDGSPTRYARDLLRSSLRRHAPSKMDHDRVFAALIAGSVTNLDFPRVEFTRTVDVANQVAEPEEAPPLRMPSTPPPPSIEPLRVEMRMSSAPPAADAMASPPAPPRIPSPPPSLPPQARPDPSRRSIAAKLRSSLAPIARSLQAGRTQLGRRWLWGAAATAVLAFWGFSYLVVASTRASGGTADAQAAQIDEEAWDSELEDELDEDLEDSEELEAEDTAGEAQAAQADGPAPAPKAADKQDGAQKKLTEAVAPKRTSRAARPRVRKRVRARSAHGGAEVTWLRSARSHVQDGNIDAALALLDKHEARYPDSSHAVERSGLRAKVLCLTGQPQRAGEIVLDLEAQNAPPALLKAISEVCIEELQF